VAAEVDALPMEGPAGVEKDEQIQPITLDSQLILIFDAFPALGPPHDLISLELVFLYLLSHAHILPIVVTLSHAIPNNICLDFIIIKNNHSLHFKAKLFISVSCLFSRSFPLLPAC
jgi:hypothetical protein